jgi:hypothetical protein
MKQFFVSALLLLFFFLNEAVAQQTNCEVMMGTIKGKYTGDCINGKANGNGKSVGTDVYEGNFKDGYPDGFGKYTWQNENYFEGSFKKGRLDGNGEMHCKTMRGQDSIVKGFWKKDKYIGQYEKPYIVKSVTTRISRVECSIVNKKGTNITLTTHQLLGSGNQGRGVIVSITGLTVIAGDYFTKYNQDLSNGSSTRFQDVIFPFRAIFFLSSGDQAEIIFNEPADYDVSLYIL